MAAAAAAGEAALRAAEQQLVDLLLLAAVRVPGSALLAAELLLGLVPGGVGEQLLKRLGDLLQVRHFGDDVIVTSEEDVG